MSQNWFPALLRKTWEQLGLAVLLALSAVSAGCGGHSSSSQPPPGPTPTPAPSTITFSSGRSLTGSGANQFLALVTNIWVMKFDGSGATPLTKLTSLGVFHSTPIWSPDGSKIAFISDRAFNGSDSSIGTNNVWVMNADGTGATPLTRLTAALADSSGPVWSSDSHKLAFTSARALDGSNAIGAQNVWVVNVDGTGATPLTKLTNASAASPAWSPDGRRIAFASNGALNGSDAPGTQNIWVMNPDGSGAAPVTRLTAVTTSTNPFWSPDSSKIVFVSNRALNGSDALNVNSTNNIWVVNADGSGASAFTRITASGGASSQPVWSPDGHKIAYTSVRALDSSDNANCSIQSGFNACVLNVWVVNADGSGAIPLTKLTAANANSAAPAWAPDGSRVAFNSRRALNGSDGLNGFPGTFNIWVVKPDGSGATPLTQEIAMFADSSAPNWHP